MRPKKQILLLDQNEYSLSTRRFLFETHAYRVHGCQDEATALQVASEHIYDLAIICLPCSGNALLSSLRRKVPHSPILVLAENKKAAETSGVLVHDAMLVAPFFTVELLERIKVLSARKRGPRKLPHTALLAMALAAQKATA